MKSEEVTEYFKKCRAFELLPGDYQKQVIRFFSEDRHYMADVSDVRSLLNSAQEIITFETYEELAEYSKHNRIGGLIACKKENWSSLDIFTQWSDQIAEIVDDESEYVLLSHFFGSEKDTPEEWYIVSY